MENRDAVAQRAPGVRAGFKPMRVDAERKTRMELTDEAEVWRVLH